MRRLLPIALVVLGVAAVLAATGAGGGSATTVQAEFTSARGLLEGNEVRVAGAPAGSVERIELTDRNTALVTLSLNDSAPAPRSDATAAIRPVDLLGDIYVSLSPGRAEEPLQGPIAPQHTSNAPRLDDLLRAFAPPVRRGLQALFVELGRASELRGEDLGRAIVELRPALEAADAAMGELGSQNAGLRALITDARHLSVQLARRSADLGVTIDAFAATVRETAARTPGIVSGLERLPDTLAALRNTAGRLEGAARDATPLAQALGDAAPPLAASAAKLPSFLAAAGPALRDTGPLLRRLRTVLREGSPALERLGGGARALAAAAPDLDALMAALVPAAGPISDGFFVNFTDQAAEPGTQPFDPNADPRRNYWRGAAVFTCEAFGRPITPNCLEAYLRSREARSAPAARRRAPSARRVVPGNRRPAPSSDAVLPELLETVPGLSAAPPAAGSPAIDNVLDYLLGS